MAAEINDEAMAMVLDVLRKAKCPNNCNQGILPLPTFGEHGREAKFCEWCLKRKDVLDGNR